MDAGEAYRQMADVKYQMEDNVKQNFLDPLTHLQNNELKDVNVRFFRISTSTLSNITNQGFKRIDLYITTRKYKLNHRH